MTSFFPDVNVWLALSVDSHSHSARAWRWMNELEDPVSLLVSRYMQLGMLRLLTSDAVMGSKTLTLGQAWQVWDRWLEDPRVEFRPEPRGLDEVFRTTVEPFSRQKASKWVADGFVLAQATQLHSTLVTFDKALHREAVRQGARCIIPAA